MGTYSNCLAYATGNIINGENAIKICDIIDSVFGKEGFKEMDNKYRFLTIKYILYKQIYGNSTDEDVDRTSAINKTKKLVLEGLKNLISDDIGNEARQELVDAQFAIIEEEIAAILPNKITTSIITGARRLDYSTGGDVVKDKSPKLIKTAAGPAKNSKDFYNWVGVCKDDNGSIHFYRIMGLFLEGFGIVGVTDANEDNITSCEATIHTESETKMTQYSPTLMKNTEYEMLGFIQVEKIAGS